jgi:putative addiction module component (TIGR02574 family)
MIADPRAIREAALKLPSQQRIELIRELEMSLESDALVADRAEFIAELDRRWEHYLRHPETAVSAEEVMASLRERLKAHAKN